MSLQKQNGTKLRNIQEIIAFHQIELQEVSKELSHQSQTVVSLKNIISTLKSKLQSKHEETQSIFRVDISKFSEEISRKCIFQKSMLESLNKLCGKLDKDSRNTKEGIDKMSNKLRELQVAVGI